MGNASFALTLFYPVHCTPPALQCFAPGVMSGDFACPGFAYSLPHAQIANTFCSYPG